MATASANPMTYEDGITRPATADEIANLAEANAKEEAILAEARAKVAAKADILKKLGLTDADLSALIG
jgi:hypothetical protein